MKNAKLVHVAAVASVLIPLALFLLRDWGFLWDQVPKFDGTLSETERIIVRESDGQFRSAGEGKYETFEELLFVQNPSFVDTVEDSLRDENCDILLITAPAGYGKSDLVTEAIDGHFGVSSSKIEVSEFCSQNSCAHTEDLALLEQTANTLPTLGSVEVGVFIRQIKELPGRVIQIDGLDELHTNAIKLLLDSIKKTRDDLEGREILLFSRPEVVDQLSADNKDRALAGVLTTSLEPHRIVSSHLRLRVKNYLDYRASREIEAGVGDKDGVIMGLNDEATVDRVTSSARDRFAEAPYLADMLRLAALSKLIIDEALDPETFALGDEELDVRRGVLTQLMDRNARSHNRPRSDARTAYTRALAAVAAAVEPANDGYFSLPGIVDAVHPHNSDERFTVIPRDVLQRSGLVSVRPERGNGRMRFEPVWLRAVLAAQSGVTKRRPVLWKWGLLAFCFGVAAYLLVLLYNIRNDGRERRE